MNERIAHLTALSTDKPLSHRHPRHGRAGRRRAGRLDRGAGRSQGLASRRSTSVPGVAQRTGATIYYIEMLPPSGRPARRSCR